MRGTVVSDHAHGVRRIETGGSSANPREMVNGAERIGYIESSG